MNNQFYFSIQVQKEQLQYAKELVEYSLKHHPVSNIWDKKKSKNPSDSLIKDKKTKELRLTGTIGEIVFADTYILKRPTKSFGAVDGQDFGKDFELILKENSFNFDVKTMHRKSNIFYKDYVLNIPARNIHRKESITDFYYCISLHEKSNNMIASFLGYISKKDIVDRKIGILYKEGTKRIRADKTSFSFYEDTYEVFFKDIITPFISPRISGFDGFEKKILR